MRFPSIETHDGRRLVVPSVLWAALGRGFNVRPSFAASGPVYRPAANAKHGGKLRPTKVAFADIAHLIGCKLAVGAGLSEGLSAMRQLVGVVFLRGGPTQVIKAIVRRIAIIVRALMGGGWRGADKGHQNKSVRQFAAQLPASKEADVFVAEAHFPLLAQPRPPIPRCFNVSPKAAKTTNRVAVRSGNGLPNFARKCINLVSHSAVPSRVWSGPRGVTSTVSGPFSLAKIQILGKGDGYALSVD